MSMGGDVLYVMKAKLMQHGPLMITCQEFEALILDYLDNRLPRRDRLLFDLHLRMCSKCREYLADYRRTIELGKSAFADPDARVPDSVPEDLVRAVMAARADGR